MERSTPLKSWIAPLMVLAVALVLATQVAARIQ